MQAAVQSAESRVQAFGIKEDVVDGRTQSRRIARAAANATAARRESTAPQPTKRYLHDSKQTAAAGVGALDDASRCSRRSCTCQRPRPPRGSRQHGNLQPGTVTSHAQPAAGEEKFHRGHVLPAKTARCEHGIIEFLHARIQSQWCGQRAHLFTLLMIIVPIFLSPRSEAFFFSAANACTEPLGAARNAPARQRGRKTLARQRMKRVARRA